MATVSRRQTISPESVAYWFFRLNGCLTIVNFVVHPELIRHDEPRSQRTDVDILAVRFAHRCELLMSGQPMRDHEAFEPSDELVDLVIAEVKSGRCRLNGPWRNPDDQNMDRVLYAIGAFDQDRVRYVARSLYEDGCYSDERFRVRLFAIGSEKNPQLAQGVVQLTWDEVLEFIWNRLTSYRREKSQHEQWDCAGKWLYRMRERMPCAARFVAEVRDSMR